jgi:hypothetical protein
MLASICTTFYVHPRIFRQKNYLKFSLQFLAGDMQLFMFSAMVATMKETHAAVMPIAMVLSVLTE